MSATRLHEVERRYFTRKVGGATPQEPLNQIKRRYWMSFLTAQDGETLAALETRWLQKVVATAGGTPNQYDNDLWKQAVLTISKVPAKFVNDNKIIFYLNAP